MNKKIVVIGVVVALLIKFLLFGFVIRYTPQSILIWDSQGYREDASALAAFIRNPTDGLQHSQYRTPGYPFFLAIFHEFLHIPLGGVVFLQILLNVLSAFFTYKTAIQINPRLGILSALIVLYDLPTTIYSLMILTEALFSFLLSLFMYTFVLYVKNKNLKKIVFIAFLLASVAYVRPAGYFLGMASAAFIIYLVILARNPRLLTHAALLVVITYSLIMLWHYRNYRFTKEFMFSTVGQATYRTQSLMGSFARNQASKAPGLSPTSYYLNATSRQLLALMTEPGSLKYFGSQPLKTMGAVVGYALVAFWLIGFLAGIAKNEKSRYFEFLTWMVMYFMAVTMVAVGWGVGPRFRVPLMPFIAILSAAGWLTIYSLLRSRKSHP
jgi:hypothetical protein